MKIDFDITTTLNTLSLFYSFFCFIGWMIGWFGFNILTSDIFWIRLEIKLWSLTRFSSPQLKASVSFSDRLLSVVCPSLCKLFTFSSCFTEPHYQFQSNLHKKIQDCSNEASRPFPLGDNYKIAIIYWRILKIFFSRTPGPIITTLGTKYPLIKELKCAQMIGHGFSKGR